MLFCTWILFIYCYVLGACDEEEEQRLKDAAEALEVFEKSEDENGSLVVTDNVMVVHFRLLVKRLKNAVPNVLVKPLSIVMNAIGVGLATAIKTIIYPVSWCYNRASEVCTQVKSFCFGPPEKKLDDESLQLKCNNANGRKNGI